jgi:hypothetical protein
MSVPTASILLGVCGAVVAICIGNALSIKYSINAEVLQLHPCRRRETSSSVISRLQPLERITAKERSTTIFQGISWEDVLL